MENLLSKIHLQLKQSLLALEECGKYKWANSKFPDGLPQLKSEKTVTFLIYNC